MRRRLAAAALCLAASPAWGYVRSTTASGRCLWWSTRQVHYAASDSTVDPAAGVCSSSPAGQVLASIQASFASWGQATVTGAPAPCTDLSPVYDGPTPSTATGLDCQNLVVFRRGACSALVPASDPCRLWAVNGGSTVNCADKYNCWDTDDPSHGDSRIIALTTVSYVDSTGEIVDADMELNAWDGSGPSPPGFWFTCVGATSDAPLPPGVCGAAGAPAPPDCRCAAAGQASCIATDVQNVVTHEAGHVLGLAHSSVAGATMQATAPLGETAKRTLAQDDVQGICAIYPAGRETAVCYGSGLAATRPPSACTQPSGCGCGTAGAEGWLGLAALLPWRRRAPGRRPEARGQ